MFQSDSNHFQVHFFSDLVGLQYFCCSWPLPVILGLIGLGQPKESGSMPTYSQKRAEFASVVLRVFIAQSTSNNSIQIPHFFLSHLMQSNQNCNLPLTKTILAAKSCFLDALASLELLRSLSQSVSRNFAEVTMQPPKLNQPASQLHQWVE